MRAVLVVMAAALAGCVVEVPAACDSDGGCKEGTCSGGVCVVEAPVIESFTATRTNISAGDVTTLTAVFKNGTGSISGFAGTVQSGVMVNVSPANSTNYVLTVANSAWGPVEQNVTVNVYPRPLINYFYASPGTVAANTASYLSYQFSGTQATIKPGVGGVACCIGGVNVFPTTNTVYTLSVINEAGDGATSTAEVQVN